MKRSLVLSVVGAVMALFLFAYPANAQNNPYRGGTGYDGGWGSKNQFFEMVGNRGYPMNPNTCFLPPRPRCGNGWGGGGGCGNGGGGGWGGGPGSYSERESGFSVTVGGNYNFLNNSWGGSSRGGRSRGNSGSIGGSVTFGESRRTMEYRPERDGRFQPQPLNGNW